VKCSVCGRETGSEYPYCQLCGLIILDEGEDE